ncbi:hypothetical protein [uncultured Rothia sp.]|uniref:hypothetical protein n=1 Tax=uncultured Rothia sp. TaxID=316088 RepID=UPI0028E1CD0D|nr:hypothetical protein [uncultured Rothia sp.]
MTMNNEPIEENSKPVASHESKTDVTRSELAKVHISPELLRTSNRISEIFYARQIPALQEALKPFQGQYATHFEEVLKPFREQNATRCREIFKVVQGQNRFIDSAAIQNLSLSKIDSIHFEVPVFKNQFSASLEIIGEVFENLLRPVNEIISLEILMSFKGITKIFPENLMEADDSAILRQGFKVAKEDGIPLYAVPRMSTILELVEADNGTSRREILVKYQESIFEDCKTVLNKVSSEHAREMRFFILAGLDALESGHAEAAQALFTNTLDTVHQNFWGQDSKSRRAVANRSRDSVAPEVIVRMNFWDAFVFYPIWNSHRMFWVHKGDDVPVEYSRHASTHGVSQRQYKLENCIQALMLVTSLLVYVDNTEQFSES